MDALTLDLSRVVRLGDDELFALCAANRDLRIERTAAGELQIMAPAGGYASSRNSGLTAALVNWNDKAEAGEVFDSSGGFVLPNGAMRAPDAAYVARARWEALSEEEQAQFPPLCPDFVAERRSPSDRLASLQEKMEEWMANGCRLGWLIDPEEQCAYIYRPGQEGAVVEGDDAVLDGEDVLPGLRLPLARVM